MANMLKKISLSVMTFTYLFAGIAHFARGDYFLKITPSFIPAPQIWVTATGAVEISLGILLFLRNTRKGACIALMVLLLAAFPMNVFMLVLAGEETTLPRWILAGRIPFQLVLLLWAYWQSRQEMD